MDVSEYVERGFHVGYEIGDIARTLNIFLTDLDRHTFTWF